MTVKKASSHIATILHQPIFSFHDYEKLFFIVDDPISSMDFHYEYTVAQSIRNFKAIFGITKHERIWIFTHNMEFFSILSRNCIINKHYLLKPGIIEVIDYRLLMPYDNHLNDILNIANGYQNPTHTTANSLRHILETVCKFEYTEKKIEKFIAENSILYENADIFTLCQDMSHGVIRNQPPFSVDILKSACKTIVEFINSKYPGQIASLK